jgi:hypothetical protein
MANSSIYILTVVFTLFYFVDNGFLHTIILAAAIGAMLALISEWIKGYNYLKKSSEHY